MGTLKIRGEGQDSTVPQLGADAITRQQRFAETIANLRRSDLGALQTLLGHVLTPTLQLADLDRAPWRRNGDAFGLSYEAAAAVGTFSAAQLILPADAQGVVVIDRLAIQSSAGGKVGLGTGVLVATSVAGGNVWLTPFERRPNVGNTGALVVERPTGGFSYVPPVLWYLSTALVAPLDQTNNFQRLAFYGAAPVVVEHVNGLVLFPGYALVIANNTANDPLNIDLRFRYVQAPELIAEP